MAIELPAHRLRQLETATASASLETILAPPLKPQREFVLQPLFVRGLEVLTGALALLLITSLIWGFLWFPKYVTVAVLLFDAYWLWKSWTIGYHALKGARLLRENASRDWRAEYEAARKRGVPVLEWNDVRHVVIIPNYKESDAKLRATLQTLASADGARLNVIPILAMEEAEDGSGARGKALAKEFAARFYELLVTVHPQGIPGEIRGKSSNEDWAARRAVDELVNHRGLDIDDLTVTSCDADTQFHQQYFAALTYHFATHQQRYRRFWQAPIFFYNNIWQVPAPLRVPNAMSGLIHLGRLSRKRRVLFSQSTYSLSMRMANDVGYWDPDIIPEDWHMFLKCFYKLDGQVEVEPIYLALGNDGALSSSRKATYVNHYLQVRRWGWGASDLPYAAKQALSHPEIPLVRRMLRLWYFFENHLMWSTQWFMLTLGGIIPLTYWLLTDNTLAPSWFFLETWSWAHLDFVPGFISLTSVIMTPTLIPFAILIVLDHQMRPPPPVTLTRRRRILSHLCWLAVSPITFYASAMPALDAQIRLMLGKRMEYRVTEKV
jgi:hypothetical protein